MSDSRELYIQPVPPVGEAAAVQSVRDERPVGLSTGHRAEGRDREIAAMTGGSLPPAYAQFMVNQDTHDVVIRIRDAATDRIITEYPSQQVEAMAAYMKQYVETLSRRRMALSDGLDN